MYLILLVAISKSINSISFLNKQFQNWNWIDPMSDTHTHTHTHRERESVCVCVLLVMIMRLHYNCHIFITFQLFIYMFWAKNWTSSCDNVIYFRFLIWWWGTSKDIQMLSSRFPYSASPFYVRWTFVTFCVSAQGQVSRGYLLFKTPETYIIYIFRAKTFNSCETLNWLKTLPYRCHITTIM